MTVEDFLETIENPDRLRIMQEGEEVFVGFLRLLKLHPEILDTIKEKKVKKFRAVPEIRHRQWKELSLAEPLEPDKAPDFAFSDLQMSLYYTIRI